MSSFPSLRSVGYLRLKEQHKLNCPAYHVESFIAEQGGRKTETVARSVREIYPKSLWPGEDDFNHLEFALKREGLHLTLLRLLLPSYEPATIQAYIASKPTSIYARRIWFLYEAFTGRELGLKNLTQGNYISLLEEEKYYTGVATRSPRHRIWVNLPGTMDFSPMIRKTKALHQWEQQHLDERCKKVLKEIPAELYERTLQYLYTQETKSSYAIEKEDPDRMRAERFAAILREAPHQDYMQKEALVRLQGAIVDPRYANEGWRDSLNEQNYVGTSQSRGRELVHFIAPKPGDIGTLMEGFLQASRSILGAPISAVIAAAAISYPFVFLHPFSDGNGRIHRFLIHYVLSHLKFAPEGVIFPVSAIMLHRLKDYDESLEAFSKRIMPVIDYFIDDRGQMTVNNETVDFYRYIDCTAMAEALFSFVEQTIREELPSEISFLKKYDETRRRMRNVVDMPNHHADLFVRSVLENGGRLSQKKRGFSQFSKLTDQEIQKLEAILEEVFQKETPGVK